MTDKKVKTKKSTPKKAAPKVSKVKKAPIAVKGKAASKAKARPKLSREEKNFDRLIGSWLDSTIYPYEDGEIDFNEVFNRLNTIFRITCSDLNVSPHQAQNILMCFHESYMEMLGTGGNYVCPECAEIEKTEKVKQDKLLN
jgi:hypothetical protein